MLGSGTPVHRILHEACLAISLGLRHHAFLAAKLNFQLWLGGEDARLVRVRLSYAHWVLFHPASHDVPYNLHSDVSLGQR